MSREFAFVAGERDAGERLDKVVVAQLKALGEVASRAEVQRAITTGTVTVDGAMVPPSRAVRSGAEIVVRLEEALSNAEADASVVFAVVFEDEHLLVVDKPAGLVVHPSRGHPGGTLVNGLLARATFDAEEREARDRLGHPRPGIVHRIDKGTSGLLVVAKTSWTRERLKTLFQTHDIARSYLALAVGVATDATIDTPHGRHPTDRLRFTSFPRGPHKRAVTHVRVVERLAEATLVDLTLETGRTHQLRVHLAERMKTPILGDPIYGTAPKHEPLRSIATALGHQALHAHVLGFRHPATGVDVRWESAPPADFTRALEALRVTRPSI